MRASYVLLPVLAMLFSAGASLAAPSTDTTSAAPPTTTRHHHLFSPGTSSATHAPATTTTTTTGAGAAGMPSAKTTATATSPTTSTGAGKFASEAQATQSCGGAGNVVWANTGTKAYHVAGDKYFGHTKHGAFMCKSAADSGGFHLSGTHKG